MKPNDIFIAVGMAMLASFYAFPWLALQLFMPSLFETLGNPALDKCWVFLKYAWINGDFLTQVQNYYQNDLGTNFIIFQLQLNAFRIFVLVLPVSFLCAYVYIQRSMEKNLTDQRITPTWAKKKDIKEFLGDDGVVLTKTIRLRQQECMEHILVVGPTGSGKTASYFLPNLLSLRDHQSAVIFDPKGEMYEQTYNYHVSRGRHVRLLKLDNHKVSACWNPLDVPKDAVQMNKVCQSVVKNKGGGGEGGGGDQDFWDATAIDLLLAMVYVVKSIPPQTYGNFRNIYFLLAELSFDAMIGLAKFSAAELNVKDLLSRTKSFSDDVSPEDTRNSTRFVLKTALNAFNIDTVSYVTAQTDLQFEELKQKPMALFVSVPEHKVDGVKVVLATLYMQMFDALLDFGKTGSPIFFFLDEFANCGKVLGFSNYIATVRSRNLSLSVCLQSPEQLKQSYSDAEMKAIMNNLKTMLILPGLKEDVSLKYISDISGKTSYMERENLQSDKRVLEKDKLPMAEIRELEDNPHTKTHEAIVIMKNKPPYKDLQRRFYLDKEFTTKLAKHGTTEFKERPEEDFVRIENQSFLDSGDIRLLEVIGTYLNYDGKPEGIAQDKVIKVVDKFAEFAEVAGLPVISAKNGELEIIWQKAKDHRGTFAQYMVTTAFSWMYKAKIYTPKS